MEEMWKNLLNVLHQIRTICQAFLTLSEQKQKVLVAANSQELEKIVKQEDSLLVEISKLEKMREKVIKEILIAHSVQDAEVSLGALKKIAKPDVREQLEVFSKDLKEIMDQLGPLQILNSELIQQALGFINYNVNVLSQIAVGPTYASGGQTDQQAPKRTLFDAKA
ncbi:MAG: FlgN protein [Pelosinus sp.]|nr:FlgN protein [Pelosinus sp.]